MRHGLPHVSESVHVVDSRQMTTLFVLVTLDVGVKYFLSGESVFKAQASLKLSNSYTLWPIVNTGAWEIISLMLVSDMDALLCSTIHSYPSPLKGILESTAL